MRGERAIVRGSTTATRAGRMALWLTLAAALGACGGAVGCATGGATPGGCGSGRSEPEGRVDEERQVTSLPRAVGGPSSTAAPGRAATWPSPACRARVDDLLGRMTLDDKVGQMVQGARDWVTPEDVTRHALGSVLSGGGSAPGDRSAMAWADMTDAYHAAARATRLSIPLVYGVDAVHGHANVRGATVFPHHIGLGCAGDPELVERVARITALEVAGTGVDWSFAPMLAAARDPRWGRTYESFGEDPALTGPLGAAEVRGLQGATLGAGPASILACAKHFAGDGATAFGTSKLATGLLDRGDVRLDDGAFRALAVRQYAPAIAAGVGTVMASYNSVRGVKMHGHRHLLTEVLRGELGFRGLVVSDWQATHELPGDYDAQIALSVNAGVDMLMEPERWREALASLRLNIARGAIPAARVDEAVRRILTVKCALGLWERGPTPRELTARVGSPEHRAVAREAVRRSLVLLKNDGPLLPLDRGVRLVLAGRTADSLGRQCGGWTVEWQGEERSTTRGTTLLQAIRAAAGDAHVIHSPDGTAFAGADVAIAVLGEPPYAEYEGDRRDLALADEDVAVLDALVATGLPVVALVVSGRPLLIAPHLHKAAAWLAAWLPGTEGDGVADVLFGAHAPTGKLSFAWPRGMSDVALHAGQAGYAPLFEVGFGLGY